MTAPVPPGYPTGPQGPEWWKRRWVQIVGGVATLVIVLGIIGAATSSKPKDTASVTATTSTSATTETTTSEAAPTTSAPVVVPTTSVPPPPPTTQAVAPTTTHVVAPATTHVAPPPTTHKAAPPPVSSSCTASMSNSHPGDGGDVTVIVRTTPSASVATIAHYKTTDHEHDGVASSSGTADVTFSIGRPTKGYTVRVDVTTSSHQSCSTEFTPS